MWKRNYNEKSTAFWLEVFKCKISRNTLQKVFFSILDQVLHRWKLNSLAKGAARLEASFLKNKGGNPSGPAAKDGFNFDNRLNTWMLVNSTMDRLTPAGAEVHKGRLRLSVVQTLAK